MPSRARSRLSAITYPALGVVTPNIVTPADGFARIGIGGVSTALHNVQDTVQKGPRTASGNLGRYLRELFVDGGATIETSTESGQRIAWTTVQPDGDLVVKFVTDPDWPAFDRWPEHVRDVRAWLEDLRVQLDALVGRIGTARLTVFAVLPLMASAYAVSGAKYGGQGRSSVWLCAVAGVLAGALTLAESVSPRRPQRVDNRSEPRADRSALCMLRERPSYNAMLVAAPPALTAVSGILQGQVIMVIVGLVIPLLALAGGYGLVLWARHRFLGRIG